MRNYSIFLLEPTVAEDYFGKEVLLYQLFSEYIRTSSQFDIIKKQVEYITRELPVFHIQQLVQKRLKNQAGFLVKDNGFEMKCVSQGGQSIAFLQLNQDCLTLHARGNFEAETCFFEVLRQLDACFYAVDEKVERYGWLNPIKHKKYVN